MLIDLDDIKDTKFASWDPGGSLTEPTTGLTCWNAVGAFLYMDQLTRKDVIAVLKLLGKTGVKVFVVEGYKVSPVVSHTYSEVLTVEMIGILIGWALANDVEVVKQYSDILKVAQLWSGVKIPEKKSISHGPTSYNHGHTYLTKRGILLPRVLKDK